MSAPPLLHRDAELGALTAALHRAAAGQGAVVPVLGEPGIGKTALTAALSGVARDLGFAVGAARADELSSRRPFAHALAAVQDGTARGRRLDEVAQALRTGPPDALGGTVDGGDRELWIVDHLVAAVEDRCATAPLLLVLDDLQWSDGSSLRVVGDLVRRAAALRLLVVAAARPPRHGTALDRLLAAARTAGAPGLALDGLPADHAADLAASLVGAEPGPALRVQVAACGGNPLYVRELVRSLADERRLVPVPGGVDLGHDDGSGTPEGLAGTVRTRLAALDVDTVRLLELASVVGSTFAVADLAVLGGRPAAQLWAELEPAVRAGVLVEHGRDLAFRHDVVREVVAATVPASARAALHLELARALVASGAPAARIAEHFARGAPLGDREAVSWLARAASEAAYSGPEVAVSLRRTALDLAAPHDPLRGLLTAQLAFDVIASGRREEGEDLCRRALEEAVYPQGEGALRLGLTESLMLRGLLPDALEHARRAVESPGVADGERAHALAWLSIGEMFLGDPADADAAAERARVAGVASGEVAAEVKGLIVRGLLARQRGALHEQLDHARAAVLAAEREPSRPVHANHPHLTLAIALADLDRFAEARERVADAHRAYERLGMRAQATFLHVYGGHVHQSAGDWDDAMTEHLAALAAAAATGAGWQLDTLSTCAVLHARRDELADARTRLAEIAELQAAGAVALDVCAAPLAQALVHESAGETASALELLWDCWELCARTGRTWSTASFAGDLARLLAARPDRARGARVASALEELAAGVPGLASLAALAARCRALADGDVDGLVAAARAACAAARPFEAVAACSDAVAALATAGRLEEAATLGQEGLGRARALGAAREATRIGASLRAMGLRSGSRGSRSRPATGWESLTVSERRVAALVAEGLSNPQIADRLIVSRRTVSTHVSNILRKLEVGSRVQLAALAARRPPGAS